MVSCEGSMTDVHLHPRASHAPNHVFVKRRRKLAILQDNFTENFGSHLLDGVFSKKRKELGGCDW